MVLEGGLRLETLSARLAAEALVLAVAQPVVAQGRAAAQALAAHVALGLQLALAALHVAPVAHLHRARRVRPAVTEVKNQDFATMKACLLTSCCTIIEFYVCLSGLLLI